VTSEELFESITAKLLSDEAISRKKMFGSIGLSIGGKVFALLVKGKLVVKLPRERVDGSTKRNGLKCSLSLGRLIGFLPGRV
jgi:TfoX/Sxy family transcriptional regulator of competence genes